MKATLLLLNDFVIGNNTRTCVLFLLIPQPGVLKILLLDNLRVSDINEKTFNIKLPTGRYTNVNLINSTCRENAKSTLFYISSWLYSY